MMGMAAGISSTGKRVFVYSIGNFPTLRCLEQIRNDVCFMNNSVVIVAVGAGYAYGPQGYTHHALEDIAVMRAWPNMEVIVPADPIETVALTKYLIETKSPTYFRLGRSNDQNIHPEKTEIFEGKFNEIRNGEAGTLLFIGSIGLIAIEAANILEKKGISISVVSVPFISNLDEEYLFNAALKGPIVTLEEHSPRGGFGSAILEFLNSRNIESKVSIVAATQENLSLVGSQDFLKKANCITSDEIISRFKLFWEFDN
jgi:transketolase